MLDSLDLVSVTGAAGFILALAITQMPTERSTVICNLATNVAYIWHFVLIGASGGIASQSIGVLNGLLKLLEHVPLAKRAHQHLWVLLGPLAATTIKTPADALPLIATGVKLRAFRMDSVLRMRIVQTVSLTPWIPCAPTAFVPATPRSPRHILFRPRADCYIVGSWSSLANVLLAICLSCVSIARYHGDEVRAALGRPRANSKRVRAPTEQGARRSPRLAQQRRREKTE